MVFVVRTIKHSFLSRAGNLTYIAFFAAQVAATLISIFGFNGYDFPPDPINDCAFCKLAYNSNGVYNGFGTNPFFAKKQVPVYDTESVYTASGECGRAWGRKKSGTSHRFLLHQPECRQQCFCRCLPHPCCSPHLTRPPCACAVCSHWLHLLRRGGLDLGPHLAHGPRPAQGRSGRRSSALCTCMLTHLAKLPAPSCLRPAACAQLPAQLPASLTRLVT